MTMSKRNRPAKNVHHNKYASKSHAEAYFSRKLGEEAKPKPLVERRPQGDFLDDLLSRVPSMGPESSELDNNLEDSSGVKKFGLWWEYQGYRFLSKCGNLANGFYKDEVLTIQPQLRRSGRENFYPLVTCNNESFYVCVRDDCFVEVAYTEHLGTDGKKHYGVRRTSNPLEVVGLKDTIEPRDFRV